MSNETEGRSEIAQVQKQDLIKKFGRSEGDTGSPEVQIALLTKRIEVLTKHSEVHKEDNHSRRGMLALISQRKRLLQHLKDCDIHRYRATLGALGLRK